MKRIDAQTLTAGIESDRIVWALLGYTVTGTDYDARAYVGRRAFDTYDVILSDYSRDDAEALTLIESLPDGVTVFIRYADDAPRTWQVRIDVWSRDEFGMPLCEATSQADTLALAIVRAWVAYKQWQIAETLV